MFFPIFLRLSLPGTILIYDSGSIDIVHYLLY